MTAYAGSKAQPGLGTTISIGATPTLIGEITELPEVMPDWETSDVTNLQSTAAEFIKTIKKGKAVTFKGNRADGDAGQTAAMAAYQSTSPVLITITLPKGDSQTTTGDTISFNALVTGCNFTASPTKEVGFSVTVQQTNAETFTAGS